MLMVANTCKIFILIIERAMPRLIKKYKNRRLYDTEISQYITVEDLQRYVVDGLPFIVEDSTSKADITNATLLQIFVEMEAGSTKFLSADMLRQLICLAHHPMSQSFKTLLEQLVETVEKQSQSNRYLSDYTQAIDAWNKQMQQLTNQWQALKWCTAK
jgi:polyhydroxyalkanoate synthesis repressor PhaR